MRAETVQRPEIRYCPRNYLKRESFSPPTTFSYLSQLKPGKFFADRYIIRRYLSRGGMSELFIAYDMEQRKEVIIKATDREYFYKFFDTEKQILEQELHPMFPRFFGSGYDGLIRYTAMEYIDGVKLSELIRERRVTLRQAIKFTVQILRGLKALHDKGWIHRDVNPDNILIEGDNIRLVDFGLACQSGYEDEAGTIAGTMGYLTPEQARAMPPKKHFDLYALGLTLFKTLTGENPMIGQTNLETAHNHMNKEMPALPSEAVDDDHRWLPAFIARLTDKSPENRFQSADEALNWLETTLRDYSPNSTPALS